MARIVIHNHLPAQDASRFTAGRGHGTGGGAYKCIACKKPTRETGLGESGYEMCRSCLAKTYIENAKNDYGPDSQEYRDMVKEYGKNIK